MSSIVTPPTIKRIRRISACAPLASCMGWPLSFLNFMLILKLAGSNQESPVMTNLASRTPLGENVDAPLGYHDTSRRS